MTDEHKTQTTHAVECVGCGYGIAPGDKRQPAPDGTIHTVCQHRRDAREQYRFFLTPHEDGVCWSFYHDRGGQESAVLYNTDGVDVIASADPRFGDMGIEPTEHFMAALAYTFHWLKSYRPLPHDEERLESEIVDEMPKYYPNGKVPDQEMWAAKLLLKFLYRHPVAPPEMGPIVRCLDDVTAFRTPEVAEYE